MKLWFKNILILLFPALFFLSADVLEDTRIDHLTGLLKKFKDDYYQQKIYLHFDKPSYTVGDDIWFKAYVVDGSDHTPDKKSVNLYIEFIGPGHQVIEMKRVQLKNGFGTGDLILRDTIEEGLYQVRAYTNWMKNFDPEFYFIKNISIKNPGFTRYISPSDAKKNKRKLKKTEKVPDIDFQFFPEGGNLVSGLPGVLGFKAIDPAGRSVELKGTVYDSKKNKITEFSTFRMGMGQFSFTPRKDTKYYAVIDYMGKQRRVNLPEALEKGVVLRVNNEHNSEIDVTLLSNRLKSVDRFTNEVVVIAQTRGNVKYSAIHDLSSGEDHFTLNKKDFPSGIAQISVFTGRYFPLAERLVFIDNHDQLLINLKDGGKNNDHLNKFIITTLDQNGKPVKANLSLSVVDAAKTDAGEYVSSVKDYLLLTSDLKGYIENPGYYFQNESPETRRALDNLMLIQGWRRFDWNNLVKNEFPPLDYEIEKGITIDGKITSEIFGIPLKNASVTLTIMEAYNDVFSQTTGKDGLFLFDGLTYYDTVDVRLEARRQSGRKNLLIVLPEPEIEKVDQFYGNYTLTTVSTRDNKKYRMELNEKLEQQIKEEEKREKERNKLTGIYGTPDAVIRSDEIPDGYSNILQVLQGRVPGLDIRGNSVVIRGIGTIYGSTDPLYLIDGIPVSDVNAVLAIPVTDVDRIEILKGPSAAIFGSRGANGVIAVYTKRGEFLKKGIIEFGMLGYATPRQFYQPKFDVIDKTGYIPSTIFWAPVIETNDQGEAVLYFELPARIASYRLVAEGISYDGKIGKTNVVF